LPLAREANQDLGAASPETLKYPCSHDFHELDADVDDFEEGVFIVPARETVAQHTDKVSAEGLRGIALPEQRGIHDECLVLRVAARGRARCEVVQSRRPVTVPAGDSAA
jgi:hypothetical protein